MAWMTKALLLLGLGFALAACNGEDEKPGDTQNSCEAPEGERGTAECKRYHAAYCDLASQCGQELCDCIDQQSAVACVSDAEAMRCANALPSASCSGVPAGCDVPDIADRGVAMAGCEQLLTTICNFQTRCRGMDPAECLPEVRMLLDCSAALGLKPIYDQCLTDIDGLACTEMELPESCTGAVLLEE
jgi:hypothetical protein